MGWDGRLMNENAQGGLRLTPEQERSRRQRNVAIAAAIGCIVVLFYAVTIAKLGPGVLERPF
jgi:hypothetical protein